MFEEKILRKYRKYQHPDDSHLGVGTEQYHYILDPDFTSATDRHIWRFFEDNSTEPTFHDIITQNLQAWFEIGKQEVFEDGMESSFSLGLTTIIHKFGNLAVEALSSLMLRRETDDRVVSEAMRWLGLLDDPETYRSRLLLLERSLRSPSPRVRDGAALGLSYLDDPYAIPSLQHAIQSESVRGLRENLQQVLEQLESTQQCPPS
jgi:hypothetical protein